MLSLRVAAPWAIPRGMWRPRFKFGDVERDRLIAILDRLAFAAIAVGALVMLYFLLQG